MLITFKSKASGDVLMFGEVAQKLLSIIGKDGSDGKGIITVEQLPEAIRQLRSAIESDKADQLSRPEEAVEDGEAASAEHSGMNAPVELSQRAWPLLKMLEYAQRDGVPVIWESD